MLVDAITSVLLALSLSTTATQVQPERDVHMANLPKGAKVRLGVLVDRPNAASHCPPTMSPDGKLLASVVNMRVQVWDVAAGRVVQSFVAHPNPYEFFGVAFVDNDTLHTLGNDGASYRNALKAWDARTGKLRRTFDVRYDWNNTPFALSSDGKLIAVITGGEPTTIRVWDADACKEVFSDKEPHGQPFFSSSSKHVITCRHHRLEYGKYDAIVTVRDARNGKNHRQVVLKDSHTFVTDVSPDGKLLVGHTNIPHAMQDKWRAPLQLFDAESGKLVRTLLEQRTGDLKSAVFSPDGKWVTGIDHAAQAIGVWEVETGKKRWAFPNGRNFFNYPRFTGDGKYIINTTSSGSVFVYDMQTGATRNLNPSHYGVVQSLAFSADGKRLATASNDSEIFIWDVATATVRERMAMTPAYYDGIGNHDWASATKLAFAPDDKHLLAQDVRGGVRLFAPHRGVELRAFRDAGNIWGFTDNGKHLLWTGVRLDALRREFQAPKQVRTDDANYWLGAARWVAYGTAFPEFQQFHCKAYASADLKSEMPRRFDFLGEASGAAATPSGLSPDGRILVEWIMRLAGNPMTGRGTYWVHDSMRFADMATGQEITRIKGGSSGGAVGSVMFAPDSRSFVAIAHGAGEKTALKLFETRTGKERLLVTMDATQYGGFAFSRDGRWFAFINAKNAIEVFDLTLGKAAVTFSQNHASPRLAFSPDGSLLASTGQSGTVLLWDLSVLKRDIAELAWTDADRKRMWEDLADTDPVKAFAAMTALRSNPSATVTLIRDRLQWRDTNRELDVLITRLGSSDFALRKKANDAIEQLGERARPALLRALPLSKSLEHKRRVEALLAQLERPFTTPVGLRVLRAIEVLDGIRTTEAAALLRELADDVPPIDPLGRELARALERAHK